MSQGSALQERPRVWTVFSQDPPRDFADGLTASARAPALPTRWGTLAFLLAACLVPRISAALWFDALWADSIVYLRLTEALEKSDFRTAFRGPGLNVYPVILMWLRKTGIDWTVIGEWWSVAMGSLAVLPLYGLFRRQFDDRVAALACLFYAVHPSLIGSCPLIIRDATYWFLFSVSLYLMWRAVTEARVWLFVPAGLAVGLAAYTRSEGWLLLVPLAGWAAIRMAHASGRRWRLALGTALCLAVIPAGVLVVNVTWLKHHSRWELGRLSIFPMVWNWAVSSCEPLVGSEAQAAEPAPVSGGPAAVRAPASQDRAAPDHTPELVQGRRVALRLAKSFTYPYGVLMLIGLVFWRRVFLRADQQVLFLHNVALFLAIWAYQSTLEAIDMRYFLPILILGLPYVALGFLEAARRLVRWAGRWRWDAENRRPALSAAMLAAVAAAGIFDVTPSAYPVMVQQTGLGHWILRARGPNATIVAPPGAGNLLAYSAQGRLVPLPKHLPPEVPAVLDVVRRSRADVVVLWEDPACRALPDMIPQIGAACRGLGYAAVAPDELPAGSREALVLVRERDASKEASRPSARRWHRRS